MKKKVVRSIQLDDTNKNLQANRFIVPPLVELLVLF